jgi:hypothetical protein
VQVLGNVSHLNRVQSNKSDWSVGQIGLVSRTNQFASRANRIHQ